MTGKWWPKLFEVSVKPLRRQLAVNKLENVRKKCIM